MSRHKRDPRKTRRLRAENFLTIKSHVMSPHHPHDSCPWCNGHARSLLMELERVRAQVRDVQEVIANRPVDRTDSALEAIEEIEVILR